MVESPIAIFIELLKELIKNSAGTFQIVFSKLIELFISLSLIANFSPLGFFAAVVFGSLVLLFVIKFVFGSPKSTLAILILYFILLIIVAIFSATAAVSINTS